LSSLFANRWALGIFWAMTSALLSWPAYNFTTRQIEYTTKEYLYDKGMDYTFALQNKIHDKQVWLSSAANSLKFGPVPIAEFFKKTLALNSEITRIEIQDKYGRVLDRIEQGSEPELGLNKQEDIGSPTLSLTRLRAVESFSTAFSQPYQRGSKLFVDMVLPTFTNGDAALIYIFTLDTDYWVSKKSGIDLPPDLKVSMVTTQRENDRSLNSLMGLGMDTEFVSTIDSQDRHLQIRFAPQDPILKRPLFILCLVFIACGALVGLILTSIHTTLLRRAAEAALFKLTESINAQSRIGLLGEVSLSIAHELNQPLTTIANYAAACEIKLKDIQDTSGELTAYLGQIREQTLRASEVVSSVRNFVQKKQNTAVNLNPAQLIEKLEPILKMMAKDHKTKIELNLEADLWILADAVLLEQVIINLVQNSLDAMNQISSALNLVYLRVFSQSADQVCIEVVDNGSGIANQIAHRVMEPYFTTKPTGLGIGLSFSRSVVEKFGGRIKFSSSVGRGTTASLVFPRVKSL
jgi:signal transduction histidine kinase